MDQRIFTFLLMIKFFSLFLIYFLCCAYAREWLCPRQKIHINLNKKSFKKINDKICMLRFKNQTKINSKPNAHSRKYNCIKHLKTLYLLQRFEQTFRNTIYNNASKRLFKVFVFCCLFLIKKSSFDFVRNKKSNEFIKKKVKYIMRDIQMILTFNWTFFVLRFETIRNFIINIYLPEMKFFLQV